MTAICAVYDFVNKDIIKKVATTFEGVKHRIEFVREVDGVKFYNDSIASSPSRAIAGLNSFDKKIKGFAVADAVLTLAVYRRMTRNDAERELDERVVEAALKAEKDLMSEGLDNIMLFSVNGKTGMEPENWREV
jgi:hypothetical protein